VRDGDRSHDPPAEARLLVAALCGSEVAGHPPVNHLRTTVVTIVAALLAALVGHWIFGEPSIPAALLIGALAAAVTIIAVELLDRPPARTTTAPPPIPPPPPPVPTQDWWQDETTAPAPAPAPSSVAAPAPPARGTFLDVERWRADASPARRFQCPRCGGFAVVRTTGDECGCQECAARWTWQTGTPWPQVSIDVHARARPPADESGAPNQPSRPRG
jgi:hypothetical protein